VEEFLQVADAEKIHASIQSQIMGMYTQRVEQIIAKQKLTPQQKAVLTEMRAKTMDAITREMEWENIKPIYVQVYKESLTQDEINQLIDLYKSPVGQLAIHKVPMVMQKATALMHQRMGPLMEKIKAINEEETAKFKAIGSPSPSPSASPTAESK